MSATTIHIVYVGGTIGMIDSRKGLLPSALHLEQDVRSCLRQRWPNLSIHWQALEPLQDSSQATLDNWFELAQYLMTLFHLNQPILILHGTDTLAYASTALAFLLPETHPPIVFTGSQTPWQNALSDAPDNLRCATQWALTLPANNVYLAFNNTLFYGSHVTKIDALNPNAFIAPHGVHCQKERHKVNKKTLQSWHAKHIEIFTCQPGNPYHGLRALLQTHPDVLIVKTLGSGNIPNVSAFQAALEESPVPLLINHSQCLVAAPNPNLYAVNSELRNLPWAYPHTLTLEALICKLHLLPNATPSLEEMRAFLLHPIDHELPPLAHSD